MNIPFVSIIIANFNYQNYVGRAIESALNVDWQNKEIIVIDDGSTDDSKAVINGYLDSGVIVFFQDNQGQVQAAQKGLELSRGDWVIFLDADDFLDTDVLTACAPFMTDDCSMVQFLMRTVDADGLPTGEIFPRFLDGVSPEKILSVDINTGAYPCAPSGGNVVSKRFLNEITPFKRGMDVATDSYFISCAPYFGSVKSVPRPLVSYRVHGLNHGSQLVYNPSRTTRDYMRHMARCRYSALTAKKNGYKVQGDRWRKSFYNMAMRFSSIKLNKNNHPSDDGLISCWLDLFKAVFVSQGLPISRHFIMFSWLFVLLVSPRKFAFYFASWRFSPASRPQLLKKLIRKI